MGAWGSSKRSRPLDSGGPFDGWASSWISNLGDGISLAAGPLLVASQTRDPFLVALALAVQRVPWLLFGLAAGVVADRYDRRRVLVGVHVTRAAVLGGLSAAILTDRVGITVVLVALFVLGSLETLGDTTAQTLLPMMVERDDLALGNARLWLSLLTRALGAQGLLSPARRATAG